MEQSNNAEMKNFLIKRIDALNEGDFLKKLTSDDLGASNIRAMGNVALNCDCYSEFRLFMEYKKAKLDGWRTTNKEGKSLADIVIEDLDHIAEKCKNDDNETLKWISQYFGYFYWKKASLEQPKPKNNSFKNGGSKNNEFNKGGKRR